MRMLIVTICALLGSGLATAQTGGDGAAMEEAFEMARIFMTTERDLMIEEELQFSAAEEDGFWPIYEDYRADIEIVQDQYAELVAGYAANYLNLSEDAADTMINEYFAIQIRLLEVRQGYAGRFRGVLSAQKLARFYQIENKIDAVAQLILMKDIPLVEIAETVRGGQR